MSVKHLRRYTLDAVDSAAKFTEFCEHYANTPMNGDEAEDKVFESVFRRKASLFAQDPAMTEIYLDIMLRRRHLREARSFLDGAVPIGGA